MKKTFESNLSCKAESYWPSQFYLFYNLRIRFITYIHLFESSLNITQLI